MTKLQDDIVGLYNSLTEFSDSTLSNGYPIKVYYEEGLNAVCFEQKGRKIVIQSLNYYCENLKFLNTYLLPGHYDLLMRSLTEIIGSGMMIRDRIMVSPTKYGFELYETPLNNIKEGPQKLAKVELVFWNSWVFRKYVELIYKKRL